MKKLYTLLSIVFIAVSLSAQIPQQMSYQAVIRNSSNGLVASSNVGMRISILQGSATGTPVYVETQAPTSNSNGLITIEIGGGTPVTGTFSGIDWSTDKYFIKTEADPLGGTTYTITGTSQLLSVPYALYAKTAGTSDTLQSQINMLKNSLAAGGVVVDYENNVYNTIKIGTQVWMAENLKTTKYNDGTAIPNIAGDATWDAATAGAYCDYNNTQANSTTYGRLYNWYAVDNNSTTRVASNGGKNVCPTGWHVPTDAEWTTLTDYLTNNGYGYESSGSDIGKSMAATFGWNTNPTAGNIGNDQASNNSSGFSGLPGGYRNVNTGRFFFGMGFGGYWWSSPALDASSTWNRALFLNFPNVYRYNSNKTMGQSVRCLKD
jgi:uncharacterized protein (TIGR02145 family)